MKISLNWLKDYINIDLSASEIAQLLTDCGLEVENIEKTESIKGGLEGFVIGEVMECAKHPNADKLSLTKVSLGHGELLPIVCGAPNVASGQKVVVATVGTTIYGESNSFIINKSKIRGEVSEGMICAEDELGLGTSHDGIMVLPPDAIPGTLASDYFNVEIDYTFEIGITPNRADATSHIGVARDLVALINCHKNADAILKLPTIDKFSINNQAYNIDIQIADIEACPRYSGLIISNLQVKESPDWLQNRLKSVGIRPINNVVDITNYVLFETGQPLHAFDFDKIESKKINVSTLSDGMIFKTLDEVERKIQSTDLMICDDKMPMCFGGVFGGFNSGVSQSTTTIFLESAYFNPVTIRKTSKYHNLKTDASFRFERGADPNITVFALKRAAILLVEICGAKVSSQVYDVYNTPILNKIVELSFSNLKKVVGCSIPKITVRQILTDLEIKILTETSETLQLEIPAFKVDVTREIDVIEEIIRIYGFNNIPIPDRVKSIVNYRSKPDNEIITNIVSDFLVSKGYYEAMNNSLTTDIYYDEKGIEILNPLSGELNMLRQDLVFGLLESISHNLKYKTENIRLFEFGKHYTKKGKQELVKDIEENTFLSLVVTGNETEESWRSPSKPTDFYTLYSTVKSLFNRLGIDFKNLKVTEQNNSDYFIQSQDISYKGQLALAKIGIIKSSLLKKFNIDKQVIFASIQWKNLVKLIGTIPFEYKHISNFPVVRRDLAILVNKDITFSQIKEIVEKTESKLIRKIGLFDVYEGKGIEAGKKSYAIDIHLQDDEKTLNDQQIDKIMERIINNLNRTIDAKLR